MPEPSKDREDYLVNAGLAEEPSTALLASKTAKDLTEHLGDLRNCIAISLVVFALAFSICFYFSGFVIRFLEEAAPEGASFFQLKPGELFMCSLKVSVFFAIAISLPVILQQIATFIWPGLKEKEREIIKPILFAAPLLYILGMLFSYYMILPPLLEFLLGFRENVVESRYGLEHFLNLEMSILGLSGVCFQLPILLIVLSLLGLVNSTKLLSLWRYVIMGAFIVSAVLTPTPDPLTMSILASALLALYYITILFLKLIKR